MCALCSSRRLVWCAPWRLVLCAVASWLAVTLVRMIKGPRDAPMACKRLPSHSIFPNRFPLGRARTQTSSCWLFRSFISEDGGSSGNDSNQQVCFPEIELPCVAAVESQAPLFSRSAPHSLRIPSTVVSDDRQCIAPSADTMRMRSFRGNKTRGRDNRWRVRRSPISQKRIPPWDTSMSGKEMSKRR